MADESGFNWKDGEQGDAFEQFDDFQLGGGVADGKSLEKLDQEASGQVPAGVHTFIIQGAKVALDPDTKEMVEFPKDCWKDGEKQVYFAYKLEVTLALKEDPSATMKEFFVLPPGLGSDDSRKKEVDLYLTATSQNVKPTKANTGFHFRKLKHFLGHAGVPIGEDGRFANLSLGELRFWSRSPDVPREIVAEVVAPKEGDKNPDGTQQRYSQIRLFSYKTAESTLTRQGGASDGGTSTSTTGVVESTSPANGSAKGGGGKRGKGRQPTAEEVLSDVDI